MTYRSDLDALRARHEALEGEVEARQQDLLETRRMIDEVERRVHLPVLDNIRVAAPCTADWAKMTGDERVRACGDCDQNVYNLSGMTREEAEALILEKEGQLCVRYYRRADGTILFADCAIGVRRRRRRRVIAGAAALLAATGAIAYEANRVVDRHVMGAMTIEPRPAPVVIPSEATAPDGGVDDATMGLVVIDPSVEQMPAERGGRSAGRAGRAGTSR